MEEQLKLKKASYNIAIFTTSKIISTVGTSILAFGISLYILKMTGSATSFAINLLCSILPRVLLAPVVGYIADNYNKKMVVISSQIMLIVTISSLLLYAEIYGMNVYAVYMMVLFYSSFSAFSSITLTASIGNLVDADRIQKAISLNQVSVSIASIAAPIVGGMLYGTVSIEVFLIIQIVAFIISTTLDSMMNFKLFMTIEQKEAKESMKESLKGAYHYIKKRQILKTVMLICLWVNLFFAAIGVGVSFILIEVLKFKAIHVGWVEASGATGMLITSLYFSMRKQLKDPIQFSKKALLSLATMLFFIAVPLVFTFESYNMIVLYLMIVFFVTAITEVCTNIPVGILLQKTTSEEYRGRVFALLETMAMGMMPLGTIIYGVLYDLIDAQYVVISTAIIVICITLYMLRPSILRVIEEENKEIEKMEEKNEKSTLKTVAE